MTGAGGVSAEIRELAARFLADAEPVDAADTIPEDHLRGLADAGLYGVFAPVAAGGLGLASLDVCSVIEELASACLASTFVWIQHLRLLGALLDPATPAALRTTLLPGAIRGEVRGGLALAGLLLGPPRLTARPTAGPGRPARQHLSAGWRPGRAAGAGSILPAGLREPPGDQERAAGPPQLSR